MSGIVGLLFREFAAIVAISIVLSVIVSLTLTPMMCVRLLTPDNKSKLSRMSRALEGFFDGLVEVYDRALVVALRHRRITLMVMILTVFATIVLFASYSPSIAPLAVNHQGQFPSVTLSFNLAQHSSIGEAAAAVQKATQDLHMPRSIAASFQGSVLAFQNSLSSTPILILAALVAVYLILGMLYESTIHPLTIISTLPSAALGALLTLMLFGMPLDVIGIIGIILLIGIVKKNGIVLVDFALTAEREQALSSEDAIHKACLLRFRPILMTTLRALFAGVPLHARHGNRVGNPPAARLRDGGRPDRFAVANDVHDPCRLYLHGSAERLDGTPQPARPCQGSRPCGESGFPRLTWGTAGAHRTRPSGDGTGPCRQKDRCSILSGPLRCAREAAAEPVFEAQARLSRPESLLPVIAKAPAVIALIR